jgi:hypothetical protein
MELKMDNEEKYQDAERLIEHPLDDVFDIEPGQTVVPYEERLPTELVPHVGYDDKDSEIEGQMQEVYDLALEAFENTTDDIDTIDPKYRARNHEVASTYLNLALTAARDKANLKSNKDRTEKMSTSGGTSANNVVMSREDLLKMMESATEEEAEADSIDGEYVEVEEDES